MSETPAARMEPPVSDAAEPFWEASKQKQLVLQWCKPCNELIHYPREFCPSCLGFDLEFRPAAGTGEIHATSVVRVPSGTMPPPYVVALVETAEGARMMTNIVGCEPEAAKVGMAVKIHWEPLSDGRHLPLWEPA